VLYGYPIAATAENWLHKCLCEILRSIHNSLQAGKTLQSWPGIIPVAYRQKLKKRTGLRDRLKEYWKAVSSLTSTNRREVLRALYDENRIALLLACKHDCTTIDDLPAQIQQPISDLFHFAFTLLTDLGVRDQHYRAIYGAESYHVCPFCGCEYFDAPGAPREALDHYLAESKYPFAAANLQNLVPMGNKCNSRYKLAQDILKREDGTRRKSFYPYSHKGIKISLNNSQPFAGTDGKMPQWCIEFDQEIEETVTWDVVFHIRERYQRDILDPFFESWLRDFSSWCRSAHVKIIPDREIIDAIARYAGYLETMGFRD